MGGRRAYNDLGGDTMKTSEAQKKAQAKYDAANTKQVRLKLNTKTDADILEQFDRCDNVQGYIKRLVRADIEKK